MGGSDQWGNIVTGTELVRRKGAGEAFALTTQLIKKSDGTKFGKTEGGNIWLDAEKTSPYKFYQFWLNTSDEDAKTYVRIFTLFDEETIKALETEQDVAPHFRVLQKALAKDITIRVHGEENMRLISLTNEFNFNSSFKWEDLFSLNEREFLEVFRSTDIFFTTKYRIPFFRDEDDILDFLIDIQNFDEANNWKKMFDSKSEIKKLILNGGVYVNKSKIDLNQKVSDFKLFNDKYLYVQKGKKNSALIVICEDIDFEFNRIQSIKYPFHS